ncbi:MAG: hypothetical protein ACXABY_02335 [Candidatus Thorarchaeota archaeon]
MRDKALVKQNIKLFLEDLLLKDGFYTSISVGETDLYSRDLSLLMPGDQVYPEPDFVSSITNKVFQSAFKNWVHEDGIPSPGSGIAGPTIASGVTVDTVFYPTATTSGTFAHLIDFPNGRVIFDTPLAGTPVVQAGFSYKEFNVDSADIFDNEKRPILIETALKDNPDVTGVVTYPSWDARTLPLILVDVLSRKNSPYELGTRDAVKDYFGVFHVWARDEFTRDEIEEIIADEHREVLLGIDFNNAPDPLLAFGAKNPNFPGYNTLAILWGQFFWRRIYLEDLSPRKDTPLYEVERSRVDFNIRVYPNF